MKGFNVESYDEWSKCLIFNKEDFIYNSNIFEKKKIVTKWMPLMRQCFYDVNITKDTMEYICIYAETYQIYENLLPEYFFSDKDASYVQKNKLIDKLQEIKTSIYNLNKNKRTPIVRKVFNYETGQTEYELEDGNFVKILENGKLEPPKIDIFSVLPVSFLKLINPIEYREQQLNDILNENR